MDSTEQDPAFGLDTTDIQDQMNEAPEVTLADVSLPEITISATPMSPMEPPVTTDNFVRTRDSVTSGLQEVCTDKAAELSDSITSELDTFQERLSRSASSLTGEVVAADLESSQTLEALPQHLQEFKQSVDARISQYNDQLGSDLAGMMGQVERFLNEELSREQEHLMLMQHNLDSQATTLQKTVTDINKKLEVERNSRTFMQRAVRENKEFLIEKMKMQQTEIDDLRVRLELSEASLGNRLWTCMSNCFPAKPKYGGDAGPAGHYEELMMHSADPM